jgi:LemA protein
MVYSAIGIALFVLLMILIIFSYNTLITTRNRFLNAFAQIDVQLKRRYDLIPNLVETVKGYMAHERQTLEQVIAARNQAHAAAQAVAEKPGDTNAMLTLASAETALGGLLTQFRGLREAYPELKADQNAANLFEELTSTENRIAFARQAYNDSVMSYNTKRQTFPINLVAGLFGFPPAALFQLDDPNQRDVVSVKLS